MTLTAEHETWAEALAVQRRHGDRTPTFIAERVAALALAGDFDGVSRWRKIAARLDALAGGTVQ